MARILITRALHQTSELADRLRALAHEPILIPAIELAEPSSFAVLDAALAQLETFHWIVFTSANAVQVFKTRAEEGLKAFEKGIEASKNVPKIAAIGPATARSLELIGLKVDLLPPQAVAESLADSLQKYVRRPDSAPVRILLIRAELARDYLPQTLRAAGADVTIAPAYRTLIPAKSIQLAQHLFKASETYPDAITFTSSSTATNLLALLEVSGLVLPQTIPRVSIGPITSQTLRDLNLPPHAEAAEATLPALIEALSALLSMHPDQG